MIRPMNERPTPTVQLTGLDANAFAIMGAVRKAMRGVGWTEGEVREVMDDMMRGDYNHLLFVAIDVCDVE